MRIIKFEGSSMREALAKVKAELGDQAVVVSTRQIKKGLIGTAFEIAAAIEDDQPSPRTAAFTASGAPASSSRLGGYAPSGSASGAGSSKGQLADDEVERVVGPLRAELRSLRAMLRARPSSSPAPADTAVNSELRSELAALRKVVEELRPALVPEPIVPKTARVIMLVGPTGVGKTTTIAKIAARAALIDNQRVALVTLDNYRVGGVDQIRTFADLIGCPLHVVEDLTHLAAQLDELADYDLTIIDTAGRSPRDRSAIASLERALAGTREVEVHLTVSAALSAAQLDDVHARFAPLRPSRLLVTKLDEVDRAPELVAAPVRLGLPITWITTGQAVPEDLELATPDLLAALAKHGLPAATDRRAA